MPFLKINELRNLIKSIFLRYHTATNHTSIVFMLSTCYLLRRLGFNYLIPSS